jgi:hypothetical protein
MIDQEFKQKAFELRKAGLSYNQICGRLAISKSTLSLWFNTTPWDEEVKKQNIARANLISRERILEINAKRSKEYDENREEMKKQAREEFKTLKTNPLFVGALMLYLGEGDKSFRSAIRICNVDPNVLAIFINFLEGFCSINKGKIRFWLLCYPDHDTVECENWWLEKLRMGRDQLYKTQVIQGRHKQKRLIYGVGNITITNTFLKAKILEWIKLTSEYLTRV